MRPVDRGRDQRARDARLAWIIVGGSAAATLVLVAVALIALRAPLLRWTAAMAADNRAPAVERDREAGKTTRDAADARTAGDAAADLPDVARQVRKRRADERGKPGGDEGEDSVRRGQGPRQPREPPPDRPSGPIA